MATGINSSIGGGISTINVRSTTGLVPVMTSASQSGYTISASSEFSSVYAGWKAFDGNTGTEWATAGATQNFWIKVQLPSAKRIWAMDLEGRVAAAGYPTYWFIQGSMDNSTWIQLAFGLDSPIAGGAHGIYRIPMIHDAHFLYYRVFVRFSAGAAPGLRTMQLYEII